MRPTPAYQTARTQAPATTGASSYDPSPTRGPRQETEMSDTRPWREEIAEVLYAALDEDGWAEHRNCGWEDGEPPTDGMCGKERYERESVSETLIPAVLAKLADLLGSDEVREAVAREIYESWWDRGGDGFREHDFADAALAVLREMVGGA